MAAIGAWTYTVPTSGSLTVNPGSGGLGVVLRLHLRNIGPGTVYVTENSAAAADGHVDSNPRGERGYMLLPGEHITINSPDANLDVTGGLSSRVSVLAEA